MQIRVRVARARADDRPAMERLLLSSGFATHGLDDSRARWVVARLGDLVIGCGCVILTDSVALIDNVAVAANHRRRSIGSTLVGVLLDDASENGAANAYVMTRDSGGFFRRMRWRNVGRGEALERTGLTVQGDAQAFSVSLAERSRVTRAERTQTAWLDGNLAQ
jgi:N-acetylglutamate synthase-like GNAT family acetyltransferase